MTLLCVLQSRPAKISDVLFHELPLPADLTCLAVLQPQPIFVAIPHSVYNLLRDLLWRQSSSAHVID